MATVQQLVEAYVQLRDAKRIMADAQAKEIGVINTKMALIEAGLLSHLDLQGAQSINTDAGTAYKTVLTKVTVKDRQAFFSFVAEQGMEHMLASSASTPAVKEFIEATGEVPPGIGINSVIKVNIRK